ncbi:MAG: DUF3470 domain-containing protein, partial [Myxococcales bacterium]
DYVQLNAKFALEWPNIAEKKESLPDAEKMKGVAPKRDLLDPAAFKG